MTIQYLQGILHNYTYSYCTPVADHMQRDLLFSKEKEQQLLEKLESSRHLFLAKDKEISVLEEQLQAKEKQLTFLAIQFEQKQKESEKGIAWVNVADYDNMVVVITLYEHTLITHYP